MTSGGRSVGIVRTQTQATEFFIITSVIDICNIIMDRLCGLVVRVPGYRCRGPGFDSRALQKK
jgi:hypothetical protein